MEFDLHIISNGNRANISLEYDNKENIDKEKLKQAINNVVDVLLSNEVSNSDFVPTNNVLIKDNDIKNNTQPDYVKETPPLEKYDGPSINGTLDCTNNKENDEKNSIIIKDSRDFLPHIVISKLRYDIENSIV